MFFEVNYEAYICSEECLAEVDRDFHNALIAGIPSFDSDDGYV